MSNEPTKRQPVWSLLGLVGPALISGYFSYRSARAEAEAKAAAGYSTLVQPLSELRKAFEDHVRDEQHRVSEVSGQFGVVREMLMHLYDQQPKLKKPASLPYEPMLSSPVLRKTASIEIPQTLDEAVAQAKK